MSSFLPESAETHSPARAAAELAAPGDTVIASLLKVIGSQKKQIEHLTAELGATMKALTASESELTALTLRHNRTENLLADALQVLNETGEGPEPPVEVTDGLKTGRTRLYDSSDILPGDAAANRLSTVNGGGPGVLPAALPVIYLPATCCVNNAQAS